MVSVAWVLDQEGCAPDLWTLLATDLWKETTWLQSLARYRQKWKWDGWRWTSGDTQILDMPHWGEKNKSLKSRMFRDAFLLLLLAQLHSHRCHRGIGKPLCRLHNMVTEFQERRLSAEGLRATGPVWACSGDQIRGDPNSSAVEHLPNRFSHLYHQNLRVSVDTVAAHHNVCGKWWCTATAHARGWSHTSSTELGCWACSAVKDRLGDPSPMAGSRHKHKPRPKEQAWERLCVCAETKQVLSEGLIDPPSSNSASGYMRERQKKEAALKTGLIQ